MFNTNKQITSKTAASLAGIFLLVLLAGVGITCGYAYVLWYLQGFGFSFIFLYVVAKAYGFLILKSYGKNYFNSIATDLKGKVFVVLFILLHVLIFWYVYWIFWFDLMVNQTSWESVTQFWIPIDIIQYSTSDVSNIWFLTTHPEKIIAFLKVNIRFGNFNMFNMTFTDEAVYFVWLVEITVTSGIIYKMIFKDEKQIA